MTVRIPISRRRFLATAAASTPITAVVPKPYLSRAADRPAITHRIQSGHVLLHSHVICGPPLDPPVPGARPARPPRLLAAAHSSENFKTTPPAPFPAAPPEPDSTANAFSDGLPTGQEIFSHTRSQDLLSPAIGAEPRTGR